jgi:hypothetical protein
MIKEMYIVNLKTWATQHWIFKTSKFKLDNKSRKTNSGWNAIIISSIYRIRRIQYEYIK